MHPSTHLRAEVQQLQDQIAELTGRLAKLEPTPQVITYRSGNRWVDPCGITRNASGEIVTPPETGAQAEARIKAEWAAHAARVDAEIAAARAGLPEGQFRDACGMIRYVNGGQLVSAVDRETAGREAVERQIALRHRAWKVQNHLPVHPLDDEDDTPTTSTTETRP